MPFEDHLREFGVKWLKLKIYPEKKIAIGYYLPLKLREAPDLKREITVAVFRPAVDMMGEETVAMPMATVRKFKRKDRKIAHWYYQELCRSYKNGILEPVTSWNTEKKSGRKTR